MTSTLIQTIAPASEPVTLSDLKDFCEITHSLKDMDLTSALAASRNEFELYTGVALMSQTWKQTLDSWGTRVIELERAPLASISSVSYYPADGGSAVTVSSSDYRVGLGGFQRFGFVEFLDTFEFPALADRFDAVSVTFVAGVASAADMPPSILRAIKMMARDLFDEKRNVITGTIVAQNPRMQRLIDPHKVRGVVA